MVIQDTLNLYLNISSLNKKLKNINKDINKIIIRNNKMNIFEVYKNYIYNVIENVKEKWKQTNSLINDKVDFYFRGGNSESYIETWSYGYNNFEGPNPTNYITYTVPSGSSSSARHFTGYLIFPELINCISITMKIYNQYTQQTSLFYCSKNDEKGTDSGSIRTTSAGSNIIEINVDRELKRIDFDFYMTGSGTFSVYGIKVNT